MNSRTFVGVLIATLCWTQQTLAERIDFSMIPNALSVNDISPDGRFLVGSVDQDSNGVADGTYLLDREADVMTMLPADGLSAVAVSDDGKYVAGEIPDPTSPISMLAARWEAATGWVSLGHLPNAKTCPSRSNSYDLSADGSVVVGLSWDGCSGRGFIWDESNGMVELQPLANGGNRASVISADGSIIGGFAQGTGSRTPAIWSSDATGELLDPPNGDRLGEVRGISEDGTVLLVEYLFDDSAFVSQATKWTQGATGWEPELIGSGSLLPGWSGRPLDIADNGTIVGFDSLLVNRRAWIQPAGEGPILDLRTYFESRGALVPPNLLLEVARKITDDGRIIVGHGSGTGAWIAKIFSDCDFDGDFTCDITDIDALVVAVSNGSPDDLFDLNDDGAVDIMDIDEWRAQAGAENLASGNAYLVGDVNLDGVVDGVDFIDWNSNKFSPTGKWSQADFNADGVTDGQDFVLWNEFKFMQADAATVPEPAGLIIAMLGVLGIRLGQSAS